MQIETRIFKSLLQRLFKYGQVTSMVKWPWFVQVTQPCLMTYATSNFLNFAENMSILAVLNKTNKYPLAYVCAAEQAVFHLAKN